MAEAAGEHESHTMTKADLVEEVTRATELPRKDSEAVVETIFDSIITALQADDKIEIRGFRSVRPRHAGLRGMDYLWTPWRYRYVADASKDEGCIFCDALAANDDARTLIA